MNEKKPQDGATQQPKAAGNWMRTVGEALKKKKAAGGWPEPHGRYGNKKTRETSK